MSLKWRKGIENLFGGRLNLNVASVRCQSIAESYDDGLFIQTEGRMLFHREDKSWKILSQSFPLMNPICSTRDGSIITAIYKLKMELLVIVGMKMDFSVRLPFIQIPIIT